MTTLRSDKHSIYHVRINRLNAFALLQLRCVSSWLLFLWSFLFFLLDVVNMWQNIHWLSFLFIFDLQVQPFFSVYLQITTSLWTIRVEISRSVQGLGIDKGWIGLKNKIDFFQICYFYDTVCWVKHTPTFIFIYVLKDTPTFPYIVLKMHQFKVILVSLYGLKDMPTFTSTVF